MNFSIEQIRDFCAAKADLKTPETEVRSILFDSRKLSAVKGTLFIALRGSRRNGHKYIKPLLEKGVRNFLVEHIPEHLQGRANFLVVPDTLVAFQRMATQIRMQRSAKIIAVTGSNGKTIVKEWLAQVLSKHVRISKTPKSYNSQIGVPLSVSNLSENAAYGIYEAGISEPDQVEKLAQILQADIGIFTNIGSAHQEYFSNRQQKIREKLRLFENCKLLVYCADHDQVAEEIATYPFKHQPDLWSWSVKGQHAHVQYHLDGNQVELNHKGATHRFALNFADDASTENALQVFTCMLALGYVPKEIIPEMTRLHSREMRLEMKKGHGNILLVNDAYTNDLESLKIALEFFTQQAGDRKKILVLSEIEQSGLSPDQLDKELERLLKGHPLDAIYLIGPALRGLVEKDKRIVAHLNTTAQFVQKIPATVFRGSALLLKGSRTHAFERIDALLAEKSHETILEINLANMVHNLNYFRKKLKPGVKLMVMVKASGYGAGSVELARMLEYHKVDYLSVAYADEGVELRKAGIELPIMVLNPEMAALDSFFDYRLEPEVYSFRMLNALLERLKASGEERLNIHLKLETGMHRLGFEHNELDVLIKLLKENEGLRIRSVFSHLAVADEPSEKAFTLKQIKRFEEMAEVLRANLPYGFDRHILNSPGISQYPQAQFEMVRLGIGLHGVSALTSEVPFLKPLGTLKATVSQIRQLNKGDSVGYGRAYVAEGNETIATISIGYADGFRRSLGDGVGQVWINDAFYPVIGRVCMDMCMIKVQEGKVQEGDAVEVFGQNQSIYQLAEQMQTIPYEVLTSVSARVKRVYVDQ